MVVPGLSSLEWLYACRVVDAAEPLNICCEEVLLMNQSHDPAVTQPPEDAVEAVVPVMPVVLPLVGAAMMFLLAFIAVKMA